MGQGVAPVPGRSGKLMPCRVPDVDEEGLCGGRYEVFENRATGTGRKIGLNIVVLPATTPELAPDPLVFLAGGGVAPATRYVPMWLEAPRSYQQALDQAFAACARQKGCHDAFPNLAREFSTLLERLAEKPVEVHLSTSSTPETRQEVEVPIDAEILCSFVGSTLYSAARIHDLPLLIHRAHAVDYQPLARRLASRGESGIPKGTFALRADELGSAEPIAAQPDAAFVAWARGRMIPLDAAGEAFRSLDAGISAARLIGVGESVHEVQTFLTFRFQLLQDLVRRHRVTALVLESGLPEAMVLDDYVRGRTAAVDYDAALPAGFGSLGEIRRTMDWLREWNLGPGRARPVAVYGADLPARSGSMVPALDRLQELTAGDPDIKILIDAVRPLAVRVSGGWWRAATEKYSALPADAKAALTSDVSRLVEGVQRLSQGDAERLEWARRLALVVQQNEAMLRLGAFSPAAPRDQAMADNTLWVLGRLAPEERAVYWAHNAHVQRVPVQGSKGSALPPGSFPAAGTRFAAALGQQYFAIATAYGGPSMDNKTPAEGGSVDATLEKVATGPFLLSLRTEPGSPAVASWLSEERSMRFQVGYLLVPLGAAFDAVAYFDRATPPFAPPPLHNPVRSPEGIAAAIAEAPRRPAGSPPSQIPPRARSCCAPRADAATARSMWYLRAPVFAWSLDGSWSCQPKSKRVTRNCLPSRCSSWNSSSAIPKGCYEPAIGRSRTSTSSCAFRCRPGPCFWMRLAAADRAGQCRAVSPGPGGPCSRLRE